MHSVKIFNKLSSWAVPNHKVLRNTGNLIEYLVFIVFIFSVDGKLTVSELIANSTNVFPGIPFPCPSHTNTTVPPLG